MIKQLEKTFVLNSAHTTYCFRVTGTGHLEHLYYGRKITIEAASDADALVERHAFAPGNTNVCDAADPTFS